jgi:hypothetical protein
MYKYMQQLLTREFLIVFDYLTCFTVAYRNESLSQADLRKQLNSRRFLISSPDVVYVTV